jgi:hypothetical protein
MLTKGDLAVGTFSRMAACFRDSTEDNHLTNAGDLTWPRLEAQNLLEDDLR